MKKNKKLALVMMMTAVLLGTASLSYAAGGQGQGTGQGTGCKGDALCIQAKQAENQGTQSGSGNGKNSTEHEVMHAEKEAEMSVIENGDLLPLTEADKTTLVFMMEEEKLAKDVYIMLYEKWGLQPFTNISESEETHKGNIQVLVEKYNIAYTMSDESGVFSDDTLQKLYDDLVTKGSKSLLDAIEVGMTIEDLDIYDLEREIAATNNTDIVTVYSNLRDGSENHMRAFYKQLEKNGGSYDAQYITDERMTEILAGSNDMQGSGGQGGNGKGGDGVGGNSGYESSQNTVVAQAQNNEKGFFERVWNFVAFWR